MPWPWGAVARTRKPQLSTGAEGEACTSSAPLPSTTAPRIRTRGSPGRTNVPWESNFLAPPQGELRMIYLPRPTVNRACSGTIRAATRGRGSRRPSRGPRSPKGPTSPRTRRSKWSRTPPCRTPSRGGRTPRTRSRAPPGAEECPDLFGQQPQPREGRARHRGTLAPSHPPASAYQTNTPMKMAASKAKNAYP